MHARTGSRALAVKLTAVASASEPVRVRDTGTETRAPKPVPGIMLLTRTGSFTVTCVVCKLTSPGLYWSAN